MPPDSKDPSLTLRVKGFDGFHVTGKRGPRLALNGLTPATTVLDLDLNPTRTSIRTRSGDYYWRTDISIFRRILAVSH